MNKKKKRDEDDEGDKEGFCAHLAVGACICGASANCSPSKCTLAREQSTNLPVQAIVPTGERHSSFALCLAMAWLTTADNCESSNQVGMSQGGCRIIFMFSIHTGPTCPLAVANLALDGCV